MSRSTKYSATKYLALWFFCAAAPALAAATTPMPQSVDPSVPRDPRIRVVDFDPNRIIQLVAYTRYQVAVEFGEGERVETIGVGDSMGWQVTPNNSANVIFVKPIALARATNMFIVTNKRRYSFELVTRSSTQAARKNIVYTMRFRYPLEPVAEKLPPTPQPLITSPPEQWNRAYSYDGASTNVPEEIFDDGKATYFRFAEGAATPAIFTISPGAGESLINFAIRGPYVVIESLAQQFILRQGEAVTRIYNDKFVVPVPGPNAPQPRETKEKKKRGFLGLFKKADQ
jgi:type IV secretion system protein VirB9